MTKYEERKREHKCTRCGKQDERTLSGKITCEDCADYMKYAYAKYCKLHADKIYKKRKAQREKWRADGLCTKCGRPVTEGYLTCDRCRPKASSRLERAAKGLCVRCGKGLAKDGSKLCESCYEKTVKALERGRKGVNTKNHP